MCGIAGFFGWDRSATVPEAALRRAGEKMALRGPDAGGFVERAGVGFVHRRLAVIDLSGGQQPASDSATGVLLTYNGEIYNFKELRTELSAKGHSFETQCDTEVLLRAWVEWGTGCINRLRGMFAFAVYDPRCDELFVVRDRMGVKPLYYSCTDEGLVLGSSVAAVLSFDSVGREVDDAAVMHYLMTIRSVLGSRTLLKHVKTLEPGTYARAQRGSGELSVTRYWEFPVVPEADKAPPPETEAAEFIRKSVCESIHEQMVSDVPLGGFLSGGVDSTIIAAVASSAGDFGAYSVGYDDHGCNEWPYVQFASETYGVRCKELHLEMDQYTDNWQFLLEQKGLPLSTPNEVPIYRLAKALRQDYTVALSGEGADELFGGYVIPYFSSFDYDRAANDDSPRTGRMMMRLYGKPGFADLTEHHFLLNSWIPPALRSQLLLSETEKPAAEVVEHYRQLFDRFDGCSTLDKQMHLHARINLEGLLNRVDASTMAASVEARVPFTDHRLAEYLFAMPDRSKIDWLGEAEKMRGRMMNVGEIDRHQLVESKRLLRRAFDGDVPKEIMTRRKVSFAVPFREWLGGPLRPFAAECLAGSKIVERLVRQEGLDELLNGPGGTMTGMFLWPLVNLAMWEKTIGVE